MNDRSPTEEEAALLLTVCALEKIDPIWKGNVFRLHLQSDAGWRDKCCGSLCDPCVMQLARAVDRFRTLLAGKTAS